MTEDQIIRDRPDRDGIWQSQTSGWLYSSNDGILAAIPGIRVSGECVLRNQYRLIIDEHGKLVCDPQSPWPKVPKTEKRWWVWDCGEWDGPYECEQVWNGAQFSRDCEIDDAGNVIRVLPPTLGGECCTTHP